MQFKPPKERATPLLLVCQKTGKIVFTSATTKDVIHFPLSADPISLDYLLREEIKDKQVDLDAKGVVLAGSFSHTGKFLVLGNDYKQLFLLSTSSANPSDWLQISCWSTSKKAMSFQFTADDSSFLMADKAGDVVRFSTSSSESEGEIILGHLSMLLDVKLLHSETFIATGDRDEKIRITCYPNTYHIQSYCLSHTKSILNLAVVGKYLLSSSADCTLKLWKPETGALLQTLKLDGMAPVTRISFLSSCAKVVCLPVNCDYLLVFSYDNDNISLIGEEKIKFESTVLDFAVGQNESLLILTDSQTEPLAVINDLSKVEKTSEIQINKYLVANSDWFRGSGAVLNEFIINLEKLSQDNVQEYIERKGKRDFREELTDSSGSPKGVGALTNPKKIPKSSS